MRSRFLLTFLLAMAAAPATAQTAACSTTAEVAQVKAVQQQLLAIPASPMDTDVPQAAIPLIASLKDALVAFADASLRCEATSTNAGALQKKLATALGANQPVVEPPPAQATDDWDKPMTGVYGDALTVKVERPKDFPHLLAVTLGYGIECGDDNLLLVYEAKDSWQRVLRWQSPRYTEVKGAFGDFFEYVFVPQPEGKWALAAAHGWPWCTSRFSAFVLDVLQPHPSMPHAIFHVQHGYSRGDGPLQLKPTRDGFDLRLRVIPLDVDLYERTGIFRYRLANGTAERVQPVAMNGRDFVDEWLQENWQEAVRWSDSAASPALQTVHEEIRHRLNSEKDYPTIHYGPVRACSISNQFQAEVDIAPGSPLYFRILQGSNSFTMISALPSTDSSCSGPDLMHHSGRTAQ